MVSSRRSVEGADMNRRRFLAKAVAIISSLIGAGIAVPTIGQIVSPALKQPESPRVMVGAVDQFEIGTPKKIEYFYYRRDGWIEERTSGSAWVVRQNDADFVVFNPRCTHLGCPYSWNVQRKQFICPCHDGIFALDGRVVAGPPPRPLDRFQHDVENGKLFLREVTKLA